MKIKAAARLKVTSSLHPWAQDMLTTLKEVDPKLAKRLDGPQSEEGIEIKIPQLRIVEAAFKAKGLKITKKLGTTTIWYSSKQGLVIDDDEGELWIRFFNEN